MGFSADFTFTAAAKSHLCLGSFNEIHSRVIMRVQNVVIHVWGECIVCVGSMYVSGSIF